MYEVEVKVCAAHAPVRDRLDDLGARRVGLVVQEDTYYDAPHKNFAETEEALRVRRERTDADDAARITYKGPLVDEDSKTRAEIETGVADDESAADIFEAVGFDPAATVTKERERYELDGFLVTLDAVDGVGEYVEVETAVDDEAEIERARADAYDLLERLGLDPSDQIRTSYLELLLDEE